MKLTVWQEKGKKSISVRYYDPVTGKAQRIYCLTQESADEVEFTMKSKLRNMLAGKGEPDAVTTEVFDRYIMWCIKNDYRPDTIQLKKDHMKTFVTTYKRLSDITSLTLRNWKMMMEQYYSPTTIAIRLRECRAFLNWCKDEAKLIQESPFDLSIREPEIKRRKVPDSEMKLLEDNMDERAKLYFYILFDHGTRRTETLKLEGEMFNLKERTLTIPGEIAKNHRERTIPLSDRTTAALKALCDKETGELPPGPLFPDWNKTTPRYYLNKAKDASGITKRVHPHLFRHTRASKWRGSTYAMMDYMGWTSMIMGKRYSHHDVEDLRRESEKK